MTLTTPHNNGNDPPDPPLDASEIILAICAVAIILPLLVGVGWVVVNLFKLAGVLDAP